MWVQLDSAGPIMPPATHTSHSAPASRQSAPEQPAEVVEKFLEIVARARMDRRGVARIAVAGVALRRRGLPAQLREQVAVDRARHCQPPRALVLLGGVLGERADDAVDRAGIETHGAQPALHVA